jgi:hypothetical protein
MERKLSGDEFCGERILWLSEHIGGEVVRGRVFNAMENGRYRPMLREIARWGIGMAVLITAIWVVMYYCRPVYKRHRSKAAVQED